MANLFAKCVPVVLLLSVWLQSSGAQLTVDDVTRVFPPVNESDSRTPLYVALMLAFSGGFVSAPIAPGVQIALNLINADQSLLPGYTLHYTFSDSQCSRAVALDSFYNEVVWAEPIKIALIGAGCSVATEPTAANSHFYNITQLACGSSSAGLEDRERFRKYFQLIPNDLELVPGFFGLMQFFGWNRVVIIQQEEDLFSLTVESLQERFNAANRQREIDGIPLFTTEVKTFNSIEGIADLEGEGVDLFDEFATIHILAMYSDNARQVICEAFKRGMLSPRYVFMTYAWYLNYWWVPHGDVNCTVEEMEQVLERSPTILSDPGILNSSEVVEAGINHTRFVDESINILEDEFESQFDYLYNAEHCFDGVWALAYALNRTIQDLEEDPEFNNRAKCEAEITEDRPFRIDDFNYNVSSVGNRIFFHLENTDFRGVTGNVSFNNMGIRDVDRVRIQQFRRNDDNSCNPDNGACLNRVEIASVSVGEAAFSYLPGEDNETTWPEGIPPDGTPFEDIVTVPVPFTVVMYILTSVGVVFTIFCLVFVIYFRKTKLIRLTSPTLNYFICCGALMLYISVYFYAIHSTESDIATILCNLRVWIAAIGYSLAFGPVLGKMWRVYFIFSNPKPHQKWHIKDWHLSIWVAFLVLIDVIILAVATAIPSARLKAILIPHEEDMFGVEKDSGIRIINLFYSCQSDSDDDQIWLGVLFGYKAILQIIGILLAFATRKVKVKGLNDAKYIAGAIYVTSIVIVVIIIIIIFNALRDYLVSLAAVYSVGFVLDATLILGLIFIPKMIALYKDPEGENIFSRSGPHSTSHGDLPDAKTFQLEQKVKELQSELDIYKENSMKVPPAEFTQPPQDNNETSYSMNGSQDTRLKNQKQVVISL